MSDPAVSLRAFVSADATRQLTLSMQHTREEFERIRREIVHAFGVRPWMLGLAKPPRRYARMRYRCLDCERRFKGPWQLAKHRRTAHG